MGALYGIGHSGAPHANVSVRTLTRRFRDEVGTSPGQWLIRQRVDLARHLLGTTDWPFDLVADRAGFGTGASLRQHLHAAVGRLTGSAQGGEGQAG